MTNTGSSTCGRCPPAEGFPASPRQRKAKCPTEQPGLTGARGQHAVKLLRMPGCACNSGGGQPSGSYNAISTLQIDVLQAGSVRRRFLH
eukprot:14086132-Alexandrium_andersonii.AAC.1